ncbi:AlpA family phage regulatory protein [Achromobacter sp. SD115]|uniref:helix-turn-helix transcriptional regulator n=1 Tax=Achromobacter sp. SD115 TaxID=2782011 RepID=UPI001A95F9B2|nr:AlpA family phage regulatory protein [Achromobacter sp. SD115]MBO1014044.1 AlpA family phage regulatory protein [Achromobacter sp. SD115]
MKPMQKRSPAMVIVLETLKETQRALSHLSTLTSTLIEAIEQEAKRSAEATSIQQERIATKSRNNVPHRHAADKLQRDGLYSWKEIASLVGIGRATWGRYVAVGKAPQPIHLGSRCTRYRGSDVLNWIASPNTYRAHADDECGASAAGSSRRITNGRKA